MPKTPSTIETPNTTESPDVSAEVSSSSPRISNKKTTVLLAALVIFFIAGSFIFKKFNKSGTSPLSLSIPGLNRPVLSTANTELKMKKFASAEEFTEYLANHQQSSAGYGVMQDSVLREVSLSAPNAKSDVSVSNGAAPQAMASQGEPNRVSETNVQVKGIDEPDIVKTDGQQIYYSTNGYYYPVSPILMEDSMKMMPGSTGIIAPRPPVQEGPTTKVIKAFPPASLAQKGKIDKSGDLLLDGKTLMVFTYNTVTGYDVSDPANPTQKWNMGYENNNRLITSRLKDGKVYLVLSNSLYQSGPCPLVSYTLNDQKISIPCGEIYYPDRSDTDIDSLFTVLKLDPATGKVEKTNSFMGSSGTTTAYMSADNMYISYQYQGDMLELMYGFLNEKGQDLVPAGMIEKLRVLRTYDISQQAKLTEMQQILNRYQAGLTNDDRLKQENELQNRMKEYMKAHARELEQTGLVKVNLDSFAVAATGSVPGHLLNQFALDEYKDHLRVATTFGGTWTQFGQAESASDVYVLDQNLRESGSIKDLGTTERIYSVRFIADRGYVVTFRQTDPFYVLDLSDAGNPQKKGELKIPGFSSYLHPISENIILGVGQEGGRVKVSLFNVSDPANPTEASKYNLTDGWTEVSSNHHAFLQDEKHKVFFMPGGQGGYIFSYEGNTLSMKKAVSDIQAKRAIFINNYMYVLGENKIVVLNEADWETVNTLSF
jgi:inhibitor of cysteine peptidase